MLLLTGFKRIIPTVLELARFVKEYLRFRFIHRIDRSKAAKESGQTFQEIAEGKGLSVDELRARMQEKKQELRAQKMEGMEVRIAQLLADEEITLEQANEKLEWIGNSEGKGKMFHSNGGEGKFMNCQQDNL